MLKRKFRDEDDDIPIASQPKRFHSSYSSIDSIDPENMVNWERCQNCKYPRLADTMCQQHKGYCRWCHKDCISYPASTLEPFAQSPVLCFGATHAYGICEIMTQSEYGAPEHFCLACRDALQTFEFPDDPQPRFPLGQPEELPDSTNLNDTELLSGAGLEDHPQLVGGSEAGDLNSPCVAADPPENLGDINHSNSVSGSTMDDTDEDSIWGSLPKQFRATNYACYKDIPLGQELYCPCCKQKRRARHFRPSSTSQYTIDICHDCFKSEQVTTDKASPVPESGRDYRICWYTKTYGFKYKCGRYLPAQQFPDSVSERHTCSECLRTSEQVRGEQRQRRLSEVLPPITIQRSWCRHHNTFHFLSCVEFKFHETGPAKGYPYLSCREGLVGKAGETWRELPSLTCTGCDRKKHLGQFIMDEGHRVSEECVDCLVRAMKKSGSKKSEGVTISQEYIDACSEVLVSGKETLTELIYIHKS
ncbi:hypothetical protein F4778DRAFT_745570 [Xylariomycetidae sp. FL2044]|nr:hypothetical protein F4778DRAFT_745570 [Xylariomycetidae sp. FL2044]